MSSEVLISGEVHVSGEVNAPVYRLAVNEEYPGKAQIESIDYTIAPINVNTIQIIDWFVAEEYTSNILSKCSFQDANKTQLHCIFDTKTVVVQSETRNYILYAQVKAITGPGSFKVYSANITYNGGKVDAVNRTMTVEIKYGEKRECHNEKPSITVISPNGGETLRLSDSITTRWITPESQKYNPVQIYFVPQDNTPKNPLNPIGYTIG